MDFKSKLVFCYFGNGIALGAYGAAEQTFQDFSNLYNWGAWGSKKKLEEFSSLSDTFGYVLTTKDKLRHGLSNFFMSKTFEYCRDKPRGVTRKNLLTVARKVADVNAEEFVEKIPLENFLVANNPCEF